MHPHHQQAPVFHAPCSSRTRIHSETWNGLRVNHHHGPLLQDYLKAIQRVMDAATSTYPTSVAILFTLKFPSALSKPEWENCLMTRFMASLSSQIDHDLRQRSHTRSCDLRYVWCREWSDEFNDHYHVAIFLNRQAYFKLGMWWDSNQLNGQTFPHELVPQNMAQRIQQAWSRALGLGLPQVAGLVHFHDNAVYHLMKQEETDLPRDYADLFERLSYWAKVETKRYGTGQRCFGSSQR